MQRIAVFISGSGSNLQALINDCREGHINGDIVLVISNKKNAFGLQRAKDAKIKAIYEKDEAKIIELLQQLQVDVIVLAGYLAILSQDFTTKYANKIINIHPSLIPSFCGKGYYGKHVHQAVLDRGVKISGATVHFVNEVTDGGPIIMQETVPVFVDDDVEDLQKRVLEVEHKLLALALSLYCDGKIDIENGKVRIK